MIECVQDVKCPYIIDAVKKGMSRCVGEVLTIIESTPLDEKACGITKKMCKQAIWRNYTDIEEEILKQAGG